MEVVTEPEAERVFPPTYQRSVGIPSGVPLDSPDDSADLSLDDVDFLVHHFCSPERKLGDETVSLAPNKVYRHLEFLNLTANLTQQTA